MAITAPVLNLKLPDVATTYNGLSDFPSWLEKLEMVSKLQGWKELQNVIPLYLVDGALAVYNSLEDKVKADYKAMVSALRRAFCKTRLSAFEAFTMRRLGSLPLFIGSSVPSFKVCQMECGSRWLLPVHWMNCLCQR